MSQMYERLPPKFFFFFFFFTFLFFTELDSTKKWDNGTRSSEINPVAGCARDRTGSYLSSLVSLWIPSQVCWHLLRLRLSSPPICGTLITFSDSRGRQIERETFVICMQRESRSYLPNMRAIQCNLAMIGRNVSNLSPRAPYMMDGSFPPRREAQRSQYEG